VAGAILRHRGSEIDREGQSQRPDQAWRGCNHGRGPPAQQIRDPRRGDGISSRRCTRSQRRPGSLSSAAIIADATWSSLRCAEELQLKSVAFPALATGVAAFPVDECAETMLGAVREYERETLRRSIQLVRFVLFGEADYKTFLSVLNRT
jgi:O-acetyl-ADP-ribose deacetylase (regulator of RNase III)